MNAIKPSLALLPFLLVSGSVQAAEFRTWTDDTGEHSVEARFAGTEEGKIKLAAKDGHPVRLVDPDRLSDADQEYLNRLNDDWNAKRTTHFRWCIRSPEYGRYRYEYVTAMLISYKNGDVTLRDAAGREKTFRYAVFQTADQKFLDEFRLMESEAGSLNDVDLPRTYASSYSPPNSQPNPQASAPPNVPQQPSSSDYSGQLAGQYDSGNGHTYDVRPNGVVVSTLWGPGTWVYEEKYHWHHIHWSNGHDVYFRPSTKGNLHIKDTRGNMSTARRIMPSPGSLHAAAGTMRK